MNNYIVELAAKLIDIDTRNKSKNEIEAAMLLKKHFDNMAVKSKIFMPCSGRGSIMAFIKGKTRETIVLHSHLDTDDYKNISDWYYNPEKSTLTNGRIYGRGALDCKGLTAVHAGIIKNLSESVSKGNIPHKSVMMLATADEESDSKYGMQYLAKETNILKDCSLVIGEGGGYPLSTGKKTYYTIQVGERDTYSAVKDSQAGNMLWNIFYGFYRKVYDINNIIYTLTPKNMKSRRKIPAGLFFSNIKEKSSDTIKFSTLPFTNIKKMSTMLIKGGFSENLSKEKTVLRSILKDYDRKYRLLPFITPGTSDNRFFRNLEIKTLGFFPICKHNSIKGIHGVNEYINIESLEFCYNVLNDFIIKLTGIEKN